MKKISLPLLSLLFFIVLTSCSEKEKKNQESAEKKEVEQVKEDKHNKQELHWSYKGETGPENWKNLSDKFVDCGGNSQSPIDIVTKNVINDESLSKPEFNYGKSKVNIINNGHTVQFNVDGNNTVKLNGKDYKLLQFHYHALSEHTIDGKYYPLEVHFVHKHADNDFAVIGLMYVEGKENDLFKNFLDKFPTEKGGKFTGEETIDLIKILPENYSYYNYNGSLTTPPCSEIVNWYVFKTPVEASKEQIEKFSKILDNNYRPVQALNGRKVKLYTE